MSRFSTAGVVALLVPSVALAFTCMWAGPFTKVALGELTTTARRP